MVRVKCKSCGSIGYTASPERVICGCGGRFKEIQEDLRNEKTELDEETAMLFDFSDFIK